MPWPTADAWAATGQVVAALLAGAALVYGAVTRHSDRKQALRSEELGRAGLVSAWFELDLHFDGKPRWMLVVENAGPAAVTEWEAAAWWYRAGPPGPGPHHESYAMDAARLGPLAPGKRLVEAMHGVVMSDHPARDIRVAMIWRDAAGRHWLRYGAELRDNETGWPQPWGVRPDSMTMAEHDQLVNDRILGATRRRTPRR